MALDNNLIAALEVFKRKDDVKRWFDCVWNLYQQDKAMAGEYVMEFRREMTRRAQQGENVAESMNYVYKSHLLTAVDSLDSYLIYLERLRPAGKQFYLPRRKVLLPIVNDLQDLDDGVIDFLGVSLPPRTGKSTLCIMFMTWVMGKRPDVANVMSGHSDKLTDGFYREVLSVISDPTTYAWNEVFPAVKLVDQSAKNETIDLERKKRFPTFTARSISGTLTGAVEIGTGGILYSDDLIEDLEESLNPDRLQAKYDAYLNQLKDRKKEGARELMVGTRWNTLDVLGRVQDQYADNPRYRFRVIPALDEQGNSNFDYPFSLGFSRKYYLDMKASIDDATWCAKYMGQPYVREGLLYPRDDLRRFYELPDGEPDAVLAICDTAEGGGDNTFLPVFAQYGQDHYLINCVCSNALPEVTDSLCANELVNRKVKMCQFESNSAGGRTADKVQELVSKQGGNAHITKRRTTANKQTKIIVNSPWVKNHCLFLDDTRIMPGSDYSKMIGLLTMYAVTGKNKTDDVPDGLAQYALFIQSLSQNVVSVVQRPF